MKINFKPLLLLLLAAFIGECVFAQSGIYVGGHFRRERNHTIADLKASGFTYVILFNVTVEANGDLTTDGETICTNGTYVFGATNPNYIADVNALKTGVTSITRVETCIGGWGSHSYTNIRNLVNSQGTGTASILYRNFSALKAAIPSVDAINNDDEEAYDVNSATAFHVMLADIGYKTTLAPYMNKTYWQSLATNVNNQRSGAVDKIYLQWYEGGAGNNPCNWNINNIELHTGDLYYENATTVIDKMSSARNNCNSKGGFYWVYNDNNINLRELSGRVNTIFGIRVKNQQEVANFYNDCDYKGFANGLEAGDYDLSRLQSLGIGNDQLSSLTVAEGFEVTVYENLNFTGASRTYRGNVSCLVADGFNDKTTSLRIRTTGSTGLDGTWLIQNRNSGKYMDLAAERVLENGGNIQQWEYAGGNNQQFQLSHLGDGAYKITAVASGKVVDVDAVSKDEGANVHQWDNVNGLNQQFVFVSSGDGYYKIIPKHSGKLVEVADASFSNGANVRQWGNNSQTCGQWRLVPIPALQKMTVPGNTAFVLYPNPVTETLYFSSPQVAGARISVININGQHIINTVMLTNSIDVSALTPGVYTIVIRQHDQTIVKKFVKN
ncbi:RICIN domain-containing protein [Chitinophaga agri]|uniref:T9SS type A sorting domain-containing protein n=1 Tax=Chitinophaga agri TaxID=2703787 RepID=A0A6B9ZBC9_9BACT|nr:RICIN domain-containing protein [Chitinophaga agri]QHS59416.1 T9SS type A sorting domain-containing protein [Chitinophaga agri]